MVQIFELVGKFLFDNSEGNKKLDDTSSKAEKLANGLKSAGDKIAGVGTKMLPVTVAIGGIGTVAVKASAEVKAMNSQFEQTFGTLQTEASSAMNRVATESGILQTRLQGVGTSIYAFAKSSGADSAEALELMETALRATADASAYYDRSLEDTSESLMSFLKGNFANDAQLGVSCTETTRNAKAMELFGQKYNDLSEIQKQQTLLKMVTDAQKLSGAMGQASRESDGFENVTGNLNESVKQLGAEFGEVLLPTVVDLIQKATAFFQKLSEMDEGTKKLIVTIALLVGGIAPVLIVLGKVISSVGTIISLGKVLIPLIGGISAPVLIAVGAITALVAVGVALYKNWDTVKAKATQLKNSLSEIFNNIKNIIADKVEKIKSLFKFEWSFPKLKMPHFKIQGKFSLNPPSVPKLGVEWYAKGGIMTQPTAFGINPNTGKMMVGGEAGAEAIAPIDTLLGYIRTVVSEENNGLLELMNRMLDKMGTATTGDIVIPVYLGNAMIDEMIVDSRKRVVLRSGGMANV